MNYKENGILSCPTYCLEHCNKTLIEIIKQKLDESLPHLQMGFLNYKDFSKFNSEASRSFHFPALECVGSDPRIAILGITKGSTQVELAMRLLTNNLQSIKNISIEELLSLINETSVHAVFAGNQIRRNISTLFRKIGLWDKLGIVYNDSSPERNVDDIIGESFQEPHQNFYIASFIKCALFTLHGKSDAPSYNEIAGISGALKCIENNLLPAFFKYPKMKLLITFGKTSYDFVYNIKINDKLIIDHFEELNINPIFLPHPSGANIANIMKYLNDDLELPWLTKLENAKYLVNNTI